MPARARCDRPDRSTGHRHLDDAERARLCGDGTAVQLAATVAPAGASGTVQFRDGGANIGAPVPVVDGSASLSYAFGSLGAHSITAVYSGGAGFASSTSEARTVTVTPPVVATSTTVTVPPTATTDLAVDLVAAVTPVGASGTVQFKDGASEIGAPVPSPAESRRSRTPSRQLAPTASPRSTRAARVSGRPPRVRGR
ncbi:hypothetical protein GS470_25200 [Rhodococcus hoagii]|nr:hypothetical protein [Prescottella equi]